MNSLDPSIFQKYYEQPTFADRYVNEPDHAVDVIIPVIHTNELWNTNLLSIYREVPVHRLLIGDGGCINDSIQIARQFPRVEILDHRGFTSLGYSVRKLIEAVETDWFIYLHSDVYLPPGWFDLMQAHQAHYDWFGCLMQHTVMVEYDLGYGDRPWAGSQMGRKRAFDAGLKQIEDDFVYRQEDFVFAEIVRRAGFKEGKVTDTFHYHQTIYKPSPWMRKISSVSLELEMAPEEKLRTWMMQLKGTIKYVPPSVPWARREVNYSILQLLEMHQLDWVEFKKWVGETNPLWLPHISKVRLQIEYLARRLIPFLMRFYRSIL